jgi:hypothetical protein
MKWLALLLAAACGSRQPKMVEHVEDDPAWAASYEKRAAAGCECRDSACLEKVHAELAKVEADHGGMDEAPPGVQKAHGDLDKCWRDGTKDAARDMNAIADAVCGCADGACLRQFEMDEMHIAGKYEQVDVTDVAAMAPGATAALARARKCVEDVTIAGDAFLAIEVKLSDTVCGCDNLGCAQSAMKEASDGYGKFLRVSGLDDIQPKLDALQPKYCQCLGDLINKEMAGSLMNPFPMKIEATITCR